MLPIVEQVDDIKKNLEETGLVLTDEVADLPEMKKDGQIFTLQIPDAFTLERLTLTLPDGEEKTYKEVNEDGIKLPKTDQGSFSVKAEVLLKKTKKMLYSFSSRLPGRGKSARKMPRIAKEKRGLMPEMVAAVQ